VRTTTNPDAVNADVTAPPSAARACSVPPLIV
jgi:hypothetical protein